MDDYGILANIVATLVCNTAHNAYNSLHSPRKSAADATWRHFADKGIRFDNECLLSQVGMMSIHDVIQFRKGLYCDDIDELARSLSGVQAATNDDQRQDQARDVMHRFFREFEDQLLTDPKWSAVILQRDIGELKLSSDNQLSQMSAQIEEILERFRKADLPSPIVQDPLPFELGPYVCIEEIGRGGFGIVYKAVDVITKKVVAVKRFEPLFFSKRDQEEARKRFVRGARICRRLHHEHIMPIIDLDEERAYLVMEYADGGDLQAYLRDRNISFQSRTRMALQLCDAVAYAHELADGILHRDIAPSNVLVDNSGMSPRLMLTDFDMAYQRGHTQLTNRGFNWRLYLPDDLRHKLEQWEQHSFNHLEQMKLTSFGLEADLYSLALVVLYLFTSFTPGPDGIGPELSRLKDVGRREKWCSDAHIEFLVSTLENALNRDAGKCIQSARELMCQLAYLLPPDENGNDKMAFIDGGPFFMGDDTHNRDERPRHNICIQTFLISRRLVTNAEFKRFLDDEANVEWRPDGHNARMHADHHYLQHWNGLDVPVEKSDHPVVFVSWHAALAYARWANSRLPTEAEWECAARAKTDSIYWWGDTADPMKANYCRTGTRTTTPSGSFPENQCGVADMLGNVREWCADWYAEEYYTSAPDVEPKGAIDGDKRVCRGGSYNSPAERIRCAARDKEPPKACKGDLGFRCARYEEQESGRQ